MRVVGLAGLTVTVRDLKGLRYVARLLAQPGREVHVLDLVAGEQGTSRATPDGRDGIPLLDDAARAAYKRRLADVEEDIDEAIAMNDPHRRLLAERDREYLLHELRRAVGLGGRARVAASTSERARTAVTRSVRYALERLAMHHPVAAAHLDQHVRTGTYCAYEPDALAPVDWRV